MEFSKSKMKVLCVTSHSDRPEAETIIGLRNRGVDIEVFCPDSAPHYRRMLDAGVPVHHLRIKGRTDSKAIHMIRGHLLENKIDILHLFNNRAVSNGLIACRRLPVKIIAYRGIVGNVSYFNPASWMTYLHPRIDRIVCVAEAVRQFFLNMRFLWHRFPQNKPVTIHKGHDLAWYHAEPEDLSQFGIAPTDFVVGCTANYRPRKGLHVLIEAMNYLPAALPIHLVLIGDINAPKLRNQVRMNEKQNRIHLTGYRDDAPAVQAACDTIVLPALRREGLPKVIIEAMAYGIPPIVTDSGGSPELIENEISGIIIPPGRPEKIAAAILKLYEDDEGRKAMGENARKRIASTFKIETTIGKTLQLYESCLQENGS
jgi:glycosyltransferase involved in cell wall biosynthesis